MSNFLLPNGIFIRAILIHGAYDPQAPVHDNRHKETPKVLDEAGFEGDSVSQSVPLPTAAAFQIPLTPPRQMLLIG